MSETMVSSNDLDQGASEYVPEEEDERPQLAIAPKDRKLVTHPYDFIIRSLKDQITDETLILSDKFQRRVVWNDSQSSRLIESLLLNVPIPVCYFAELDAGKYAVIDGKQRLTAIFRFLSNEFRLRGLRVLTELNGKDFKELEEGNKRWIATRTIRCIVVLKESNPDIRFDVFERLNSGSVNLNPQELRNSMFRGSLNDLVMELSEYEPFMKTRNVEIIDKRMRDCELVLRFFAFHFDLHNYRGYYASFLDDYLKNGTTFEAKRIAEHEQVFKRTIDDVQFVFGQHAFRRHLQGEGWQPAVNRAIYDVIMLTFARIPSDKIRENKPGILEGLKQLCTDAEFTEAVTSSTKDKSKIKSRLDKCRGVMVKLGMDLPEFVVGQPTAE